MRYLSLSDGIGAAHVAWAPLNWRCAGASEIAEFPMAVVRARHPGIEELGDMHGFKSWNIEQPDLICGGTPCQSFSVAGLRGGMDDPRGNLSLVFLAAVGRFRPTWVVFENVPGLLSTDRGRAFGALLGALGKLGYGFAYRVLDARYFGVPQHRRRLFIVAYRGDWRPPAAVLFERHSLEGLAAPDPEAWAVAPAGAGYDPLAAGVPIAFKVRGGGNGDGTRGGVIGATGGRGYLGSAGSAFTCATREDQHLFIPTTPGVVRRFTPIEYERLQGFPDNYTRIPWNNKPEEECPHHLRYKAIGNSWPIPLITWLGRRIESVTRLLAAARPEPMSLTL